MNPEFMSTLDYMEKEKGIKRDQMLEAIQNALLTAARKAVGPANDLQVQIDPRTGKIKATAKLKVVDRVRIPHDEIQLSKAREINAAALLGELLEVEVTPKDFGRIAAQVFKQSMNQTIRGIERTMIFTEFKDRADSIVTGTVRRFEKSDVVVDLGKFEAIMPKSERVPTEEYQSGERIRAYVVSVENTTRGPEIVLSRSHPNFVKKLFELEVGELLDGTVQVKAIAREPGYRTKMAVWSENDKVDPVGACVGIRGSRVKNIVRELNNEKIDLFKWSSNPRELVVEALKPAKLKSVDLNETEKRIKVHVDTENLKLAIGIRGRNARLASRLMGWEIDIEEEVVTIESMEDKLSHVAEALASRLSIDPALASQLVHVGFTSVEVIAEAEENDLKEALPEVDSEIIQKIRTEALKSLSPA
ncbi:MAG: transcription termination factor NusA [Verrucomicrobiota bacterium]